MHDQTNTEVANLPPAQRAVLALGSSKAELQLREIIKESAEITTVIDVAGREQAHRAGMKLKNARTAIEKTGKVAREDAQAFSRAVIAEEARLKAIITDEESRIFKLRDAFDAKVAAEKAEKDRIEQVRIATIKAKIQDIRTLPIASVSDTSEDLAATITDLEALEPAADIFAEFVADAEAAKAEALAALRPMHDAAIAREAEAARLAAQRAELERLQAVAAERERQAAEVRAAEEARARAEREAEQARMDKERTQLAEDRRAFEEQQAAAKRAEQTAKAPLPPITSCADEYRAAIRLAKVVDAVLPEPLATMLSDSVETTANDKANQAFDVRAYADCTAHQIAALASKVSAARFNDLASQLHHAADALLDGVYDTELSAAYVNAMRQADEEMLYACLECRVILKAADKRTA